jgi:rare lipoprotein A
VRVTNLKNGQSVTVRINDRGPFVRNRSIDLSDAAAGAIGMKDAGVAPVKMEVVR